MLQSPGESQSILYSASRSSSELSLNNSYLLVALQASTPGVQLLAMNLWISGLVCLSRIWGESLPFDLSSSMGPNKVAEFSLFCFNL